MLPFRGGMKQTFPAKGSFFFFFQWANKKNNTMFHSTKQSLRTNEFSRISRVIFMYVCAHLSFIYLYTPSQGCIRNKPVVALLELARVVQGHAMDGARGKWYCTVFVISIFFPWLCSSKLFFFYGDVEGFSKYLYIYFINVRVKEV